MDGLSRAVAGPRFDAFPFREAAPGLRAAGGVATALLVAGFATVGAISGSHLQADFEYFYKAGVWLLAHGGLDRGYDVLADGAIHERGMLDWYLPFTHRFMTLFAWLPPTAASWAWLAMNLGVMAATVRLLGARLMGLPPRDWFVSQFLPLMFLATYWYWEFRLNQINNLTLLLLVGSFVCWQDGRRTVAGFWLGLATLIKVTPGLIAVWFLLKREYRTFAAAVVTAILAGPVSDLIVFGADYATEGYRGWVNNAVHSGSHTALVLEQREMDWRNQGLGAVLSRWLHPTNYATHFDNDPRIVLRYDDVFINVADWRLEDVARLTNIVAALSLVALAVLARRPAAAMSAWELRYEWALFVLAMLWFMPVMRIYHMIWAAPAVTMLASGVTYAGWRRWSVLAWLGIVAAVAAQIALLWKPVRAMGVTQWSVALLALPLAAMLIRLRRNPAAIAGDQFAGSVHAARGGRRPEGPTFAPSGAEAIAANV